mgnify:CR=1 FL=1
MANNHYVSKLILKRFARDISTFNMETNTLVEKNFIKKFSVMMIFTMKISRKN